MDVASSLRRFSLVLVLLAATALVLVFVFDQLIVAQVKLQTSFAEAGRILITLVFGLITIIFIRRSKPLIIRYVGPRPATIFQSFMVLIVGIVVIFSILNIFEVSPTTLLVGGGLVSIIVGLVISTFVGNVLAGTLVFMMNPFHVGDSVLVNNVPGKVVEMTSMVTRIRNDVGGQLVIPNTAIVQGSVIITKVPSDETLSEVGRLPYRVGDRVYTTYMNEEGTVKELSPFHTKILLDSGREVTFLNTSVLAGLAGVAKVNRAPEDLRFSFKIEGNVEKAIEAIKCAASSNPSIFTSDPVVLYSALEGKTVELEFNCKTSPNAQREAKNIILKAAYLSSSGRP